MSMTAKYMLSRLCRDEPRMTASPPDFANGRLLSNIAIPKREYIGMNESVNDSALCARSSENNNVFPIRAITQAMTANDPA